MEATKKTKPKAPKKAKTTPAPPKEGNYEVDFFREDELKIQLEQLQGKELTDYRIVHRVTRMQDCETPTVVTWNRTPLLVLFEDHECVLCKDEFGKGILLKRKKESMSILMDTVLEDTCYKDGIIYRTETVYSKSYNNIVGLFNDYLSKPSK